LVVNDVDTTFFKLSLRQSNFILLRKKHLMKALGDVMEVANKLVAELGFKE
jgi:hypothetical protein